MISLNYDEIKFDNYKINDFGFLDSFNYYIKFNVITYNKCRYYWGNLLLQGYELEREKRLCLMYGYVYINVYSN